MYCKKCGQQINEGAAFCGNCGTPVGTKNLNTAFQAAEAGQDKKKKSGKKVLGILILCLVILLCSGAGGWFFLYKPNDDKSKDTAKEEELSDETKESADNDDTEEIQEADEREIVENSQDVGTPQEVEAVESEEEETEADEPAYSEDDEYGIHTYELIVEDVTWTEAYNACIARGGHLVRINSDEEYQAILEQIAYEEKDNIKFWLGGARKEDEYEYHWIYEDGTAGSAVLNEDEPYRYYWLDGEPSFHDESVSLDEMYMNMFYISREGRWIWNDVPNDLLAVVEYYSGTVGYICEYED